MAIDNMVAASGRMRGEAATVNVADLIASIEAAVKAAIPAGENTIGAVNVNGSATITHTAVSVGATTTAALAANPDRKYALFVNDSDATIYLMIGAGAAANQGIRLNANGGSFEMSAHFGNLAVEAINAISSGSNKNLLVTEGE